MNQPSLIEKRANATISDRRWLSVVSRDPATDGQFYYSVKTTGVYCRPSCAARPPKPENVQFYSSIADAKKDGFRPCKSCKPDGPILAELNAQKVALACRLIERSEEVPSLKE